MIKLIIATLLLVQNAVLNSVEPDSRAASAPFNYVIGTQAIGGRYHFTQDAPLLESAKLIAELGSGGSRGQAKSNNTTSSQRERWGFRPLSPSIIRCDAMGP